MTVAEPHAAAGSSDPDLTPSHADLSQGSQVDCPDLSESAAAQAPEPDHSDTTLPAKQLSIRFDILTLFPEMFHSYLGQGHLKRAIERGLVNIQLHNFRDYAPGKRKQVDDKPFGGGPGMLIMCQPVFDCVEAVQAQEQQPGRLLMMTPQGRRLDQTLVEELSGEPRLLLLCGRYEGFDDRIRQGLRPLEVSVGDFICNGGEVPAMLIVDTVIRLIPGVLHDETSSRYDSFSHAGLLEHPQFTRPREYRGMTVPDVLINGNHKDIQKWQQQQSLQRTAERRSDLLPDNSNL